MGKFNSGDHYIYYCGQEFHRRNGVALRVNKSPKCSSVQFSHSVMSDSLPPHGLQHARLPRPSPTPGVYSNSCPSSQWCHPAIFPSIRVFSNESVLRIRWPKYWSYSFSISPCNEYSGLVSSRMDWLDLLAVQGTLKSLLQHHSSKASILRCLAFFRVQLSYPHCYWKNHSFD